MRFTVERDIKGAWHSVAVAIEASGARQAVARAASEAGLYRARPHGLADLHELFWVPQWGPPEPVTEEE